MAPRQSRQSDREAVMQEEKRERTKTKDSLESANNKNKGQTVCRLLDNQAQFTYRQTVCQLAGPGHRQTDKIDIQTNQKWCTSEHWETTKGQERHEMTRKGRTKGFRASDILGLWKVSDLWVDTDRHLCNEMNSHCFVYFLFSCLSSPLWTYEQANQKLISKGRLWQWHGCWRWW